MYISGKYTMRYGDVKIRRYSRDSGRWKSVHVARQQQVISLFHQVYGVVGGFRPRRHCPVALCGGWREKATKTNDYVRIIMAATSTKMTDGIVVLLSWFVATYMRVRASIEILHREISELKNRNSFTAHDDAQIYIYIFMSDPRRSSGISSRARL